MQKSSDRVLQKEVLTVYGTSPTVIGKITKLEFRKWSKKNSRLCRVFFISNRVFFQLKEKKVRGKSLPEAPQQWLIINGSILTGFVTFPGLLAQARTIGHFTISMQVRGFNKCMLSSKEKSQLTTNNLLLFLQADADQPLELPNKRLL